MSPEKLIRSATFSMREIAQEAGVSYVAVRAWASGIRAPEPRSLERLARGIEKRAHKLLRIAAELRKAADPK